MLLIESVVLYKFDIGFVVAFVRCPSFLCSLGLLRVLYLLFKIVLLRLNVCSLFSVFLMLVCVLSSWLLCVRCAISRVCGMCCLLCVRVLCSSLWWFDCRVLCSRPLICAFSLFRIAYVLLLCVLGVWFCSRDLVLCS